MVIMGMKVDMKRSIKRLLTGLLSLFFIFFFWNPMAAMGEIREPRMGVEYHEVRRRDDVMKILSVLKERVGDQESLERAKGKLFTLKDSEFNLINSLSEQITKEGERPGVDIAFLLITALIILS
jgi:hypothetical protein